MLTLWPCPPGILTPGYGNTPIAVQPPQNYSCTPGQFIRTFQLAAVHTGLIVGDANPDFGTAYLGYISAKCSDGEQLPSVQFSVDTDPDCSNLQRPTSLDAIQTFSYNKGFTLIDYR